MCFGEALESGGFLGGPAEGCFPEESFEGELVNFSEWLDAAAGNGDGGFSHGQPKGLAKLGWGDEKFGNLAMICGADEAFRAAGLEADVQDGIGKCRIGGVTVGFPVRGPGIDFDVSSERRIIDFNGAMREVRAWAVIPFTELGDGDGAPVFEAELTSEGAGEPECLKFQFGRKLWDGDFFEGKRGMPNALK